MPIDELTRLLECGEYRRCLQEAARLLALDDVDTEFRVRTQAMICRSYLELGDCFAASEAGELAVALAEAASAPDVLGFVLVDLATAQGRIRQHARALAAFSRYLGELPAFTAARCMEGTVLKRMAWSLQQAGNSVEALQRYQEAREWFERFGDVVAAAECVSSSIRIHLERGEAAEAHELLREGNRYTDGSGSNGRPLAAHLLDRALCLSAVGRYEESNLDAFRVLERSEGEFGQQCRAHLILCHNALALGRPGDAFNFAMGARVAAIDGRIYDLEFEASEILFRLLHERGTRLVRELENEYYRVGVDLFQYISKRVVDRMDRGH